MVPYATLLIPLYVLLKALGLQNSLLGLSLVLAVFQLPVRHVHDADLVRRGAPGDRGVGARRRLPGRSRSCAGSCCRPSDPG